MIFEDLEKMEILHQTVSKPFLFPKIQKSIMSYKAISSYTFREKKKV